MYLAVKTTAHVAVQSYSLTATKLVTTFIMFSITSISENGSTCSALSNTFLDYHPTRKPFNGDELITCHIIVENIFSGGYVHITGSGYVHITGSG